MKIFGIGTDIVNIKRIEKIIKKNGDSFKNKFFSKKEINYCEKKKNPSSFYAKRFAAKEAVTKAMGTGIGKGISLKNIEVINNINGKPDIILKGNVDAFLKKQIKRKKYDIYLSLSDDKPWAHATVIISYN
jgi:holo-[acyl-carrier protein] synthase